MINQTIKTIWDQIGGNKFGVMVGAKDIFGTGQSLYLKFGRNSSKSNHLRITLEASDTYSMRFSHTRKGTTTIDADYQDVYAEDLQRFFTKHTGMATSLRFEKLEV